METKYGKARKRTDGYYQITTKPNKGKLLHRLIYEEVYGSIPANFCVHHKDGNKENNNPTNLVLLSKSNHHSIHNRGSNHPLWGKGKIDNAGGIEFLSAMKNQGKTMTRVSEELGYTAPVPVFQYLKNRNLRWNQL